MRLSVLRSATVERRLRWCGRVVDTDCCLLTLLCQQRTLMPGNGRKIARALWCLSKYLRVKRDALYLAATLKQLPPKTQNLCVCRVRSSERLRMKLFCSLAGGKIRGAKLNITTMLTEIGDL